MSTWFTPAQVIMLACAPLLMVVVSWFERRWGPQVAGIVAAAPVTAVIGLLLVESELGAGASHSMALKMGGYVPAQVGVAAIVATLVARLGFARALSTGMVAYAALATLTAHLPGVVAIAASLVLLAVGRRVVRAPLEPDSVEEPTGPGGTLMVVLRAGIALLTAVALLVTARLAGPAAGGAIGAFPVFTFTLCAFVFASSGQLGVRRVLAGLVQGLPPYFAFVVAYGLATERVGAVAASLIGAVVCAACYLVPVWRAARRRHRSAAVQPPTLRSRGADVNASCVALEGRSAAYKLSRMPLSRLALSRWAAFVSR